MTVAEAHAEARQKAESGSGWYAAVARAGIAAKGVSYGLVGVLALLLALGQGGKATSRGGALKSLAHHPFGNAVLIGLALGFAAYALWRFLQAWFERVDPDETTLAVWGKRAGYVGRGLIYAGLMYSTLHIVVNADANQSQDAKAHKSTALAFQQPGGRWLVGLAGLVLIGVAFWNLYRGVARKFEKKWRMSSLGPSVRRWGSRAGVAGHVARFVVFGLIGTFVVKAAWDYRPKDAIGLDGALQKLADGAYGSWLLGLTAAGLVAYGLYCLVDARLRDVAANR